MNMMQTSARVDRGIVRTVRDNRMGGRPYHPSPDSLLLSNAQIAADLTTPGKVSSQFTLFQTRLDRSTHTKDSISPGYRAPQEGPDGVSLVKILLQPPSSALFGALSNLRGGVTEVLLN